MAVRDKFPPVAEIALSAGLRGRRRGRPGGGFGVGDVSDGVSRGHRGWFARCRPLVRFLHRGVFREVGEDRADGYGFFDAGGSRPRTAAQFACANSGDH